jgi:hypothetical protein
MLSGGDEDEVVRWLRNFVTSHAKREDPRAEAMVERQGARYGVRLRLGKALHPPVGQGPIELSHEEVASHRGQLAWCATLAERIRALVRDPARATAGAGRPA